MANMKVYTMLLAFLVISTLAIEAFAGTNYGNNSLKPGQCTGQCTKRCSAVTPHRIHDCMFFCQKCCAKCLCVPPGISGNKQVCPCYNNWKTKKGGPKCP